MSGPRLTAPAAKLARSISTTTTPAAISSSATLLTSSKAAAPLSRKYADLLKERNTDADHPRHLYTRSSNRPHPQPRKLRLMQTFASSSTPVAAASTMSIDNMIFPGSAALEGAAVDPFGHLRMPLLPDSFTTQNSREVADGPIAAGEISIVAANPELVSPAALTEVEGMGVDGVELKFVHDGDAAMAEQQDQGMLTNMLKGIDNMLGGGRNKGNLAL
ncbi:Uu.00g101930.m01.CDS01 [Anthostomella pinea]|uniref:Uu.00g101930.m01.CDS01 n=1 Tax=Anthostomella pinea TaxID=933095 RepID=A0AAI8VDC7_9PEZI|nr:Uu.00g101930.m01.CDS01 [Anthostomella pinea]